MICYSQDKNTPTMDIQVSVYGKVCFVRDLPKYHTINNVFTINEITSTIMLYTKIPYHRNIIDKISHITDFIGNIHTEPPPNPLYQAINNIIRHNFHKNVHGKFLGQNIIQIMSISYPKF